VAAGGGCSEGITMKPRSWQVLPSLRGVLIGAQVVLIVLMLGGAIFLAVGVKTLVDSQRFQARAVATNGVVVEIAEGVESVRRGSGDNWYYEDVTIFHPVVRFVTAREQEVRFRASEGSEDPSRYGVGDSIGVLYDPANPRDARLDTWVSRRGDSITLVAIGLGLVVLGAVGVWLLRSPGRAARRAAQQQRHRGAHTVE
jgi:type II secretory pathway pseudopilin PulG